MMSLGVEEAEEVVAAVAEAPVEGDVQVFVVLEGAEVAQDVAVHSMVLIHQVHTNQAHNIFHTPVIAKQTKLGSRAKLFTGVVAGYLVTKYLLRNAPVYRGGFPVYGSYVSNPQNRAVRLSSERVSLLDSNGNLCLGRSSQKRTLKEGTEDNIIELNTTVNYTASPGK